MADTVQAVSAHPPGIEWPVTELRAADNECLARPKNITEVWRADIT